MLAETEKVHFHGIRLNYRRYLDVKPCGIWSDYSDAEFWLMTVKLQVPWEHGAKAQSNLAVAHSREIGEASFFPAGFLPAWLT